MHELHANFPCHVENPKPHASNTFGLQVGAFSHFVTDKYLKWKFRKLSYDPIHPQNLFARLVSSLYKTEPTELLARGPIGNPRYQTY